MANQSNINGEIEINFLAGKMNKDFDERIVPSGQYIDALNIRIGSSELDSVGAIENSKGNTKLTEIVFGPNGLGKLARCIGTFEDGANETIYWFVCDPGNVDMILSYNTNNGVITYHVISVTVLNFDQQYLITGINKIDDLLFWTDDLNPPRKINVNRNYPNPVLGIDGILEDDISVIVSPPLESPTLELLSIPGEENFITEKFISFAYRYKYKDNEYSALSQFSDIAFEPGNFNLDYSTYSNIGMQNIFNSVNITFNVGGHNVIGVDLCFKLSNSNIVNVIERYNRDDKGWTIDNSYQSISFTNQKIYTTLTESELLRLYDNVPRTAKSQSIIGSRLIYGNYIDGYDVEPLNYELELLSEDIGFLEIPYTLDDGDVYTIDPDITKTINDSRLNIDLTGIALTNDSVLSIQFNLVHDSYSGDSNFDDLPDSPGPSNELLYDFIFTLRRDYISVYDLATSSEFINAISTHELFADCGIVTGTSVTDYFNCNAVPKMPYGIYGYWNPIGSGIINEVGEFKITSSIGSNIIGIQVPAYKYKTEYPIGSGLYLYGYDYLRNIITDVYFSKLGSRESLHTNMDYEVAIVYMDDYLRSSTALVCNNNTIFVPSSNSELKNYIRASVNNLAPEWATKYKFVIKPSKNQYEIVYTNIFFHDTDGSTWFKLDGDNRSKVKDNDVLIVKRDSSGAVNNLVKTKVLDYLSQPEDFIKLNESDSGEPIKEPSGVYIRLRPSNFIAEYLPNSYIDYGEASSRYGESVYDLNIPNPDYNDAFPIAPGNWDRIPYDVPAGSQISIFIEFNRQRRGGKCGKSNYTFEKTFTSSQDYANFFDFVQGDNIDLRTGVFTGTDFDNANVQYPYIVPYSPSLLYHIQFIQGTNQYQFQQSGSDGPLYLVARTGTPSCGGISIRHSTSNIHVTTQRATSLMVFETEAAQADGETYFEGSASFKIDPITRFHEGSNGMYQTDTTPAVVDLNFFNCYSFGNGVESYKINDSVVGVPFYLGSRVTAVSKEEFKEANRYAGLTYSGVYNSENNLNKLNEFNLALSNWKDCDKSFGPINKLYARKTDLLLLQEDKISYVLYEKNLISDAAAGGAITSTPEVLGTQIARIEDYGISNNPESFAVRGSEIFFTDSKRTAVLNLKGGYGKSEQLDISSNYGLKNWFRNEFKDTLGYQKLGGFDPYMNEYVLALNDVKLPYTQDIYNCGVTISQDLFIGSYTFTLELNQVVGDIIFDYIVTEGEVNITVVYDSVEVVNELVLGIGTLSFTKDSVFPITATVTISCEVKSSYTLTPNCPISDEITVVRVVVNSAANVDQTIHNNYKWVLGTFNSSRNIDYVLLESDGISLYDADTAMNSVGVIPAFGSTIVIDSTKLITDTFVFEEGVNSFKYLVSDTLYTELDIPTLLLDSNNAIPILNPSTGKYESSFVYDNPTSKQYLYLIWDYREPDYSILDYSPEDYSTTY